MLSPKEEFKKKRGPDGSPGVLQPPKKQYTGNANNDERKEDAEMTTDQVLLQFQKKAMFVKLHEHKYEIQRLQKRISTLEEKQTSADQNVYSVHCVWNSLLEDLHLILGRINSDASGLEVLPPSGGLNGSKKSSFLQMLLEANNGDGEDLEGSLKKRSEETKKILSKIVIAVENEQAQRESLTSRLSGDSDVKVKALVEENEKLVKQQQTMRASIEELHIRHKKMNQACNKSNESLVGAEQRLEKMQDEILEAREMMEMANRKAVKLEMKYKEEIEKLKNQMNDASHRSTSNEMESAKPMQMIEEKVEQKEPEKVSPPTEEVDKNVQAELEELKTLAESRLQTIEQYEKDRVEFVRDLEKCHRELANLPMERVVHSTPYQILQQKLSYALQEIETLKQSNDKANRQILESVRQIQTERDLVEAAEQSRRDSLERDLKAAESRAAKYKVERDQVRRDLELKGPLSPNTSAKEWKSILAGRDAELKKLKDQMDHLKEDSAKLLTYKEDSKKNQEKIYDVIDQKKLEIKDLSAKVQDYVKIIDDYKQRKKKWEEKERELKSIIEVFQTQAKDRREINELRISEKKLQEANAALEIELAKNAAKPDESKNKELEEQYAEHLRVLKAEYGAKLAKAEKTIKAMTTSLDKHKSENDSLLAEIEDIGKAFEDSQEQNIRILQQLNEKEDTLTKLVAEQMRSQQLQNSLKDEKHALEDKASKALETIAKLDDTCSKNEAKMKLVDQQLVINFEKATEVFKRKQAEELRSSAVYAEGLKRSARENSQQFGELKFHIEKLEKEVNEHKTAAEEKAIQLEKQRQANNRLSEELNVVRLKLDKTSHGEMDSILEEEIRNLKQKLTCSICKDRPKSAIISRCSHVFCRHCINKNLEVRSRKCPGCGKPFAESDVHNIYL